MFGDRVRKMLNCGSLIRLIRRRLVLGLIFVVSLTYCAFSLRNEKGGSLSLDNSLDNVDLMMINDNNEDLMPDDNTLLDELKTSGKFPSWQMEILERAANDNTGNMDTSSLNESDTSTQSCRNSIQGKGLIVDERGIVCSRREVLPNGCCAIDQRQTSKNDALSMERKEKKERYSCKTCNPQGCCTIYEYCVSCCLHPDKQIHQIRGRKDALSGSVRAQKDEGRMRIRNLDRFHICLAACRTSSSSVRHENTYKDPFAKHCYTLQRHRRNINSLNNNGGSSAVVVTSSSAVMFFTYLSPGYHFSYHSLNESHVYSFHININIIDSHILILLNYYSHS